MGKEPRLFGGKKKYEDPREGEFENRSRKKAWEDKRRRLHEEGKRRGVAENRLRYERRRAADFKTSVRRKNGAGRRRWRKGRQS